MSWLTLLSIRKKRRSDVSKLCTITPAVGMQVWYWPDETDHDRGYVQIRASQPLHGTVAFIRETNIVNLSIHDSLGRHFNRANVPLYQPMQEVRPDEGGFCEWPPYLLDLWDVQWSNR